MGEYVQHAVILVLVVAAAAWLGRVMWVGMSGKKGGGGGGCGPCGGCGGK